MGAVMKAHKGDVDGLLAKKLAAELMSDAYEDKVEEATQAACAAKRIRKIHPLGNPRRRQHAVDDLPIIEQPSE